MICVYQLIFTNSHTYIGKTTNFNIRLTSHLNQVNPGPKLKQAWDTETYLGHKILEVCDVESLSDREKYWIDKLSPSLNVLPGGEGLSGLNSPRNKTSIEDIEYILDRFVNTYEPYHAIATNLDLPYQRVRDICIGKAHAWATANIDIAYHVNKRKPVYSIYDRNNTEYLVIKGEFSDFESMHDLSPGTISNVLNKGSYNNWYDSPQQLYEVTTPLDEVLTLNRYELTKLMRSYGCNSYNVKQVLAEKSSVGWAGKKLSYKS